MSFGDDTSLLDTRDAVPELSIGERARVDQFRASLRASKQAEAEAQREAWIDARAREIVSAAADDEQVQHARAVVQRALQSSFLTGEFPVVVVRDGNETAYTIADILADPATFHGATVLDPVEPDYKERKGVGVLFLDRGQPVLFSWAHGGQTYKLLRQQDELEIRRGKIAELVDATLEVLRRAPNVFDMGDALVLVEDGRYFVLDEPALAYLLGTLIQYWRWHAPPRGVLVKVLENPPPALVKQLIALKHRRRLKPLDAVITAPTIRPDGTVLSKYGYDAETRLFLDADETTGPINEHPSPDDVRQAIDRLMSPFRKFDFVTADDLAVFLAALLTVVVRASLPTAPAYGLDAPVQGSGKSLLAECLSLLGTGRIPAPYPHATGHDDEEIRKRIFSAFLRGDLVIIWDNVVGAFDSPALAAALTSQCFSDRVLGRSESLSVPNKSTFFMTGNNLSLIGDMARRVLKIRIDPGTDRPFAREFDFDPRDYMRTHRSEMVIAALIILRGWLTSARTPRAPGRMASFEAWDDLVRQAVVWVGRDICPGDFGDPMSSVIAAHVADPEYEAWSEVLSAWWDIYGDRAVTAATVQSDISPTSLLDRISRPANWRLCAALKAINDNATHSSKSLGRVLQYRVDRVASGRRMQCRVDAHTKVKLWFVTALADHELSAGCSNRFTAGFAGFAGSNSDPNAVDVQVVDNAHDTRSAAAHTTRKVRKPRLRKREVDA